MDLVGVIEKLKKGLAISKPTYIHRLTDEYRRVVAVCSTPHIFVSLGRTSINI
jgi:hypothetical protein